MLTRLKVSGFKNLVGVDIRFGPFTCIAGPNGSGKSNLFDAISFFPFWRSHHRGVQGESTQNPQPLGSGGMVLVKAMAACRADPGMLAIMGMVGNG